MSNPIGSASFAPQPAASYQSNSPGSVNSIGAVIQMPAGANPTLLNGLLKSLQTSLGGLKMGSSIDTAVDSSPYSTAAAGTPGEPTSVTVGATTLTEAGYVSPVLLQQFSDSLFQALQAGGLGGVGAATAGTGNAASASYQGGLVSSLQNLIQESGANAGPDSDAAKLQTSFANLMQNSGIAVTSGMAANGTIQPSGLQTFLSGLLVNVQNGSTSSSGLNVNTTA